RGWRSLHSSASARAQKEGVRNGHSVLSQPSLQESHYFLTTGELVQSDQRRSPLPNERARPSPRPNSVASNGRGSFEPSFNLNAARIQDSALPGQSRRSWWLAPGWLSLLRRDIYV